MSSSDPLLSTRLKVERARQHLDALREETRAFAETKPYRYVTERDPETGDHVVRLRFTRPDVRMPLRFGLIAGDAVHNMRTALDHLAVQLADRLGTGATVRTQFPVFDNSKEYGRQEKRLLEGIHPRHRTVIETMQPYHVRSRIEAGVPLDPAQDGVRTTLLLVARLDNLDKHSLLLPSVPIVEFGEPQSEGLDSATGRYPAAYVRVEDGAEVFRITSFTRSPGASEVKMKSKPAFGIVFGEVETGDPTPDALRSLWADRRRAFAGVGDLHGAADVVLSIVDRFAPDFD